MDRALGLGLTFFDTANVCGWKLGAGCTEQSLGRGFAQGGDLREQVVLATKAYGRIGDGPNDRRLSACQVHRACEDSQRRKVTRLAKRTRTLRAARVFRGVTVSGPLTRVSRARRCTAAAPAGRGRQSTGPSGSGCRRAPGCA